jgi:hypothetical protein
MTTGGKIWHFGAAQDWFGAGSPESVTIWFTTMLTVDPLA